jgi:hypothetical protein
MTTASTVATISRSNRCRMDRPGNGIVLVHGHRTFDKQG